MVIFSSEELSSFAAEVLLGKAGISFDHYLLTQTSKEILRRHTQ